MSMNLLGASLYLACGGAIFLLGILLLRESPAERLHRITATMMFFGGLGPVLGGAGMLLSHYGPQDLVLSTDLSTTFACVWEFFFPSLLLFALVFPSERKILGRFSRFTVFLYGPHLFHITLVLLLARYGDSLTGWRLENPVTIEGVIYRSLTWITTLGGLFIGLLTRFHIRFFSLVDVLYSGAAIMLLAWSFKGLRIPKIRRQLSAILFGLGTCVGLYAVAVPVPTILSRELPENLRVVLVSVALLLGTGSIAFAIVRRSFLDVGTVVRRGILLSGTSGLLALAYLVAARQLDNTLAGMAGIHLPIFQTLFVILTIVFFHPILGRMEETVDRLLAGDRVAHRNIMRRLGREMTAILDLPTLEKTVVETLRDALGVDRAHLLLRDRKGEGMRVCGGELSPISMEHPLIRAVAQTFDPVRPRDLLDEMESAADRARARELTETLGSRLLVPIHLPEGGGCIGCLSFGPKVTGSRYNAEETTLLSILATQIGIAVRNARLHEEAVERRVIDEELAMARAIQESIFSNRGPRCAGVDVAALSLPSRQVGGDYYDLVPMSDGSLGVAIGDVSGKGVPAALLMSMLHAALHAQMNGAVSVGRLTKRVNQILCRSTSVEKFATFFFGIYDQNNRIFRFCNGGHNYPILLKADGTIISLSAGGLVLGISEEITYDEESVSLVSGDLLVFYTDGVTEEAKGDGEDQFFGEERLIEVLRRHQGEKAEVILQAVHDEVARFAGRPRFSDDFTLIVLRAVTEGAT